MIKTRTGKLLQMFQFQEGASATQQVLPIRRAKLLEIASIKLIKTLVREKHFIALDVNQLGVCIDIAACKPCSSSNMV